MTKREALDAVTARRYKFDDLCLEIRAEEREAIKKATDQAVLKIAIEREAMQRDVDKLVREYEAKLKSQLAIA